VNLHERREWAESFGADAARYDRSRPTYPAELIDDILESEVATVVDVGCGTGIVGRLFAARGAQVVGVEADSRMAAIARDHGLEVEVARFEEWDPRGRTFDALVSGQAWHWVDPLQGVDKAAAVLRPSGRFAVFWNGLIHAPDVRDAFDRIYADRAPELLVNSVALGTARSAGELDGPPLERSGEFRDLERRVYRWERTYTTAAWVDELPTHSGHRMLAPDVRDALLDEVAAALDGLGGEMTVVYRTAALFAVRR
jgi:SAM-dependent methyltransferase